MKPIPYASQWIDNKDIRAVTRVLKSPFITQGPAVAAFERAIAKYCGAKFAVAVNSGTSALHLACLAAGIKKGDEVITSPITFVASANCILYCAGKPVFADIDGKTVSIDPRQIEKKITKRTKAVIPVDFAGHPADLGTIKKIARRKKLLVIDDASHALGAKYKRKRLGSGHYADMTVFSFHAVKQIATGEGGMVLTNNRQFYQRLLKLRTHGITRDPKFLKRQRGPWYYEMQDLGYNYRLTDIQSVLGLCQLKKLSRFLKRKRAIVAAYNKAFQKYKEIGLLSEPRNGKSAHHLYVIRFKREHFSVPKQRIIQEYRKNGILVNFHYIPVYRHPFYRKIGFKNTRCPQAERYYQEAVTLPLYPKMTDSQVKRVIKTTDRIIRTLRKK